MSDYTGDPRFKDAPFNDPCEICKHHVRTAGDEYPCNDCVHMMNDHWEKKEE